jgi:hypothetical protein
MFGAHRRDRVRALARHGVHIRQELLEVAVDVARKRRLGQHDQASTGRCRLLGNSTRALDVSLELEEFGVEFNGDFERCSHHDVPFA